MSEHGQVRRIFELESQLSEDSTPAERRVQEIKSTQDLTDWLNERPSSLSVCSDNPTFHDECHLSEDNSPESVMIMILTQNRRQMQTIIDLATPNTISLESKSTNETITGDICALSPSEKHEVRLESKSESNSNAVQNLISEHGSRSSKSGLGNSTGLNSVDNVEARTGEELRLGRSKRQQRVIFIVSPDNCTEFDYIEKPSASQIDDALEGGLIMERSIADREMKLPNYLAGMQATIRRPHPERILSYLGWARSVKYVTRWSDGHITCEPARFLKENFPEVIHEWRKLKRRSRPKIRAR